MPSVLRLLGSTLIVPLCVAATRVGKLHRVLVLKCTVCGLTNTFDFEIIFYVGRHSLDGISPDCLN